jgi:Protein of unknown function (DUF3313)
MANILQPKSISSWLLAALVAVGQSLCAHAAAQAFPATLEGLVKVPSKRLAAVYLLPGEDFRAYTKIMIDPVQVSFRKGWLKDMNLSRSMSRKISEDDARKIADEMRSGFQDIFTAAFKAKGYEVVTAPGSDVLRLSPEVVNVYLNAPDPMGGAGVRTYTVEAGEATLGLMARDSTTGALLGVAMDRSTTGGAGSAGLTTSASNRGQFENLFKYWARICVNGLEQLKANAVPAAQSGKKR